MAEKSRAQVAYSDLREWMEEARKLGELKEVEGASLGPNI